MTNEKTLLDAAQLELTTIAERWSTNDLQNNPVRRALAELSAAFEETGEVDEAGLFEQVAAGELTDAQAREALARFFGVDENGNEINEDGSRR